jgi:acetyltransferase EpsM
MAKKLKIAIWGAREDGGLATVLDIVKRAGNLEVVGLIDDHMHKGEKSLGLKVIGCNKNLKEIRNMFSGVVCAIGSNEARRRIAGHLKKARIKPITLIDPTSIIGFNVNIGDGSVVYPNVVINSGTRIGKGVLVNTSCSIDHDNRIGDFVNICPGVHTAGRVSLEDDVFIGTGVSIIPDAKVGRNAVVGAGSVVVDDIPAGVTAVGAPARAIKRMKKRE